MVSAGANFDVLIAGAGPAGATLALRLARAGLRVALAEACRFPRPKPCGEFLSPECLPLFEELGVAADVAALGGSAIDGMLLHGAGRRVAGRFVPIGGAAPRVAHGLAVRRERLDLALRDAALRGGAVDYLDEQRVVALRRAADGAVIGAALRDRKGVRRELAARLVVGADGLRSRVARALDATRPVAWLAKIALATRFGGGGCARWGRLAELHLVDGGFFACAPVDGGLVSLNLVLERERYVAERAAPAVVLERFLERTPALAARLAGAARVDPVRGVGPMACTTTRPDFPGAALVGDACGYVDPITGEGIWFALEGARLLAAALLSARDRGPDAQRRALAGYAAARRRELAPRVRLATLLQRGLRHPAVVSAAFRFFAARPGVVDLLVAVTGDYVPLRELRRPAVWKAALARRSA